MWTIHFLLSFDILIVFYVHFLPKMDFYARFTFTRVEENLTRILKDFVLFLFYFTYKFINFNNK